MRRVDNASSKARTCPSQRRSYLAGKSDQSPEGKDVIEPRFGTGCHVLLSSNHVGVSLRSVQSQEAKMMHRAKQTEARALEVAMLKIKHRQDRLNELSTEEER
jgi:hypothetical protein